MLRALVLALALANLLFFAWTRGWLDGVTGVRATGDREPERLLRQVRPEVVRILATEGAAAVPEGAGSATSTPSASAPPMAPAAPPARPASGSTS